MPGKTKSPAEWFEKIGLYTVGILAAAIGFFLSAVSMLHTTHVEMIGDDEAVYTIVYNIKAQIESVIYYNDNLFLNLMVLALSLLVMFLLASRLRNIPFRFLKLGLFLWTFALGTVWVISSQSAPTNDSWMVTEAAVSFAQNHFAVLHDDRYFHNYSFQLGYTLFCEICIRFLSLFQKPETLIALEILNAGFLAVINLFLLLILNCVCKDSRVNLIAAVLLALSTAPILSCSFLYGIYPGMAFALIALYCEIRWLTESKIRFAVIAALSIMIAVMMKSNYLIWLVAMVLIALVKLPARKKYLHDAGFLAVSLALALCIQPAVKQLYEKRGNADLGESVPYISWIAMGLNESDLAPGWYNIWYTVTNFEVSNFDAAVASERSKEEIQRRLQYFVKDPQYTNDFFYLKTVSQWNETSYQSIWNNIVRKQYREKGAIAEWACGSGKPLVRKEMDLFAQLIYFGFCAGCIYMLRKKEFMLTPLPVIFLGGFFYQLIAEGKSQYILPYFIVMTGFAAFGIVSLMDALLLKYGFLKRLISPKEKSAANESGDAVIPANAD